ncbi:hypothetical protein Poli38472_014530 [Pythium oligandrum]|uniref:PDZ domain-containing protein n=1 Tax=Pythium oligandrum TaxID=41045 RepID=A0A8K1CDI9_PYTOL|nr:hypothetical protein Poli38472_014530 [Pythium oligandrum]|eukprot:TMW61069.1 hypothetical protein Poli38472_014530 [Pythium oligandrum]
MEYEVLWGDGPLGLTLRPDLGEDMPPVVGRITRLDSAAALAKVAVGDMLVSINGMDTARQGYDHVVDLLQKIPRPATLRFRVPRQQSLGSVGMSTPKLSSSSLLRDRSMKAPSRSSATSVSSVSSSSSSSSRIKHEQYTVVWTEGPLGMILRPDDDDVHVPCIRKITGKGAGTGMERAAVGDVLVAVNGQETKSLGFRSTISLLKTIRKPAVLKFKRMHRRISRRRSSRDELGNGSPSAAMPSMSVKLSSPMTSSPSPPAMAKEYGAYDIVWREGDLGLKLKPGHRDIPILSKLTGKGTASGLQNAAVGDELVSVNGVLVEGQAYHDTLRMLKHSQKPAVLRFRPNADRRVSTMSTKSTRSNPSTMREVAHVRSKHVPIYDSGRPTPPTSSSSSSSRHARDPSSERSRTRTKKRIPLNVAMELVAASLGMDLDTATFAGLPITEIREGTEEAHLLRVEAKMCIQAKAEHKRNGLPAKEAFMRAQQEARVLQEALQKVKDQARQYEKFLEQQKKETVLASAIRNKPEEVVGRHNNLIAELTGAIAPLYRESYSEDDVIPMKLEEQEKLMDDLHTVMNIPVVVPKTKYCAECGATEKESKLDLDDDGQYYCKDCWDNFLNGGAPSAAATPDVIPEEEVPAPEAPPSPVPAPKVPSPPPSPPVPQSPPAPAVVRGESIARLAVADREEEERTARLEAEKKLMELQELTRGGSTLSIGRQANVTPVDRTRRERRGLEELAQALLEEEERARAEGNLTLAKKLSAQRARTMAESKAEQNGQSPYPSLRDVFDSSDSGFYRNGKSGSTNALHVPETDSGTLKRAATMDYKPKPVEPTPVPVPVVVPVVSPPSPPPAPEPTPANDYDDVDEDEEADDQVDMSDGEDDVLREVEEKNFALAKQLDEAHSVIERARQSIMLGDDEDDIMGDLGLSDEQINLFKKLTSQADERMSMVDRMHPQDESDSDSDESVFEENDGEEDEEEEEDDGVWI